jgi:hypothetical protein
VEYFDNRVGHVLNRGMLLMVYDKTAAKLAVAFSEEIAITFSTWHYDSGGCC